MFGSYRWPRQNGQDFKGVYTFLRESQWWDKGRLRKYQLAQLKRLIRHAYGTVPYYRRLFDGCGISPSDINEQSDLRLLPCLTREDIRKHLHDMVSSAFPLSTLRLLSTSGTSGSPLRYYVDERKFNSTELAFITTLWNRVGYTFQDRTTILRGGVPMGGVFEIDSLNHQLRLSSIAMTDDNMELFVRLIREFKPKFIQAYPSSIFVLAKFMKRMGLEPFPTVKALLLGSEQVHGFQRELLENVLNCRVFSWYGHRERTVLGGECECSHYYHLFSEYGVTEILAKDGEALSEDNATGEIVATGFVNWAMPFIRYRTGDVGVYTLENCDCGRSYPMVKRVEGRVQEFVIGRDDNPVPLRAVIMDAEWAGVTDIRVIQERRGVLEIVIARNPKFPDSELTDYVLHIIRSRVGASFGLSATVVEEIPLSASGKYQYLVQKLSVDY